MPTTLTTLFFLSIFIAPEITPEWIDQFNQRTNEQLDQNFEYSISRIDSAIILSQRINYTYGEAYALYQKGYLMNESNESGKALIANLTSLRLLEILEDADAIETRIRLHINTGLILHKHFKYDEAILHYNEGLEIAIANGLDAWQSELYYKIGYSYKKQGNLNESIDWFKRAYENSVNLNDDYILVNSLNMLGLAFSTNGSYEKAREYFQLVLDHEYKTVSESKYFGKAYHNIANSFLSQDNFELAEANFNKALVYKNQRNRVSEVFLTKLDLANMYFLSGDLEKSYSLANSCASVYSQLKNSPDNYKLYSLLRKIEFKQGNYRKAETYATTYEKENQKFLHQQQELIQIRDQFKMDILTASYFSELDREKQISELTSAIYFIILFIFIGFIIWKIRQLYVKRMLERELRTAIQDFNLDDL